MSSYIPNSNSSPFEIAKSQLLSQSPSQFNELLSQQTIEKSFDDANATFATEDDAIFTPTITLWGFLSQMLFKGEQRSCIAAVARIAVLLVALKKTPCCGDTSAYCRARLKLSETVIEQLMLQVATTAEAALPSKWLWKNRHIKMVDGTTSSMPDTIENQTVYPQQKRQKEGLGFPIMRVVILISLATAMVGGIAFGPYAGKGTGETALLRSLFDQLNLGDILLADRYYCSYFMIALLLQNNVDFVVRLHQLRAKSKQRDTMQIWKRPQRPKWMDQETYELMPILIRVRLLNVRVTQRGYRVKNLHVVTTLTDKRKYSCDEICDLYHQRWHVELDIRSIKIAMGLDILRCKTPEMVRKEMLAGVLMYNLIRQTMLQTAEQHDLSPRCISFTAALQQTAPFWQAVAFCDTQQLTTLIDVLMRNLSKEIVGKRPGRVEPRAKKRRPKKGKLLMVPRTVARQNLLNDQSV